MFGISDLHKPKIKIPSKHTNNRFVVTAWPRHRSPRSLYSPKSEDGMHLVPAMYRDWQGYSSRALHPGTCHRRRFGSKVFGSGPVSWSLWMSLI